MLLISQFLSNLNWIPLQLTFPIYSFPWHQPFPTCRLHHPLVSWTPTQDLRSRRDMLLHFEECLHLVRLGLKVQKRVLMYHSYFNRLTARRVLNDGHQIHSVSYPTNSVVRPNRSFNTSPSISTNTGDFIRCLSHKSYFRVFQTIF